MNAILVVAACVYISCIFVGLDKKRSPVGKMVIIGARSTLASIGILLYMILVRTGSSYYTQLATGFGFMIAAVYLPWIAADALESRSPAGSKTSRASEDSRKASG